MHANHLVHLAEPALCLHAPKQRPHLYQKLSSDVSCLQSVVQGSMVRRRTRVQVPCSAVYVGQSSFLGLAVHKRLAEDTRLRTANEDLAVEGLVSGQV